LINRRRRKTRDLGQPGDWLIGGPEERRFRATWRFTDGKAVWCAIRGDSEIHQTAPEGSGFGATRKSNRRRYRKTEVRGNSNPGQSAPPKDAAFEATRRSIAGKAGGEGRGATRDLHRRRCRRREVTGRPGASLKPVTLKEPDIWGDSNIPRRHGRRTEDSGQPGASVAEAALGSGIRGDPQTETWLNRRMQGARQLATSSAG
jgi:hypothetical protein